MGETLLALWQSLWGANPASGRLVVLAIACVIAKASIESRRQLNRYRHEKREIGRVSRWLAEWRSGSATSDERETPETQSDPGTIAAQGEEEIPVGGSSEGEPTDESEDTEGATPAEEVTLPVPGLPEEARPQLEPGSQAAGKTPPHPGLIDLDQLIHSVDPSSLIGDRLRAIAGMRLYRVKVDIDTLQKLALNRDAAAPGQGFPGFAAGLSMLLGIFGTFIGLSAMVQQIDLGLPTDTASLTLDSWMSSVSQLGVVLGGMKTAFSTSLVGIAGALVCSAAAYRISHRRRQVFEVLERLTAAELIPATVPAVEDEVLLAQVSRQMDDSFSRLDEIFRQNQEALENLTAAQQAFVAIVDEVRNITRGQAAHNLDQILGQLARSNEAVLAVSRQIPGIVKAFGVSADGFRESAERIRWQGPAVSLHNVRILGLRPATWVGILVALATGLGLAKALSAF